jgi:hypothetical protein
VQLIISRRERGDRALCLVIQWLPKTKRGKKMTFPSLKVILEHLSYFVKRRVGKKIKVTLYFIYMRIHDTHPRDAIIESIISKRRMVILGAIR